MDGRSIGNELKTGRIVIHSTQNGLLIKGIGGAFLIGLGVFLFVAADMMQLSQIEYWFMKFIVVLWLAIIIPAFIKAMIQESNRTPKITLDSSGIDIQIGLNAPGLVPWSEIKEFRISTMYSVRMLGVILKNPDSMYHISHPIARLYHKLNHWVSDASWFLSAKGLDIEFDQFVELVHEYHRNYG